MNATKTKHFSFQGKIQEQVEVEALDIQLKATDIACRVKGLYKDVATGVRPVFNINFGTGALPEPVIDIEPG